MKRAALAAIVAALVVQHGTDAVLAQGSSGTFRFFKSFFVTGDYVVGAVGLRGSGGVPQPITISGVPPNADVLGAFLYWQSVVSISTLSSASVGVTFEGQPIGGVTDVDGNGTIATLVNVGGSTPCWSAGGATGSSNGSKTLAVLRADVLRFITTIDPATGKLAVNRTFYVSVPDAGTGNSLPLAQGATLIIIYRDSSQGRDPQTQRLMPALKSIVLYDGAFTMDNASDRFRLGLSGFFQPSALGATGRLTAIVGDGQANFSEKIVVNSLGVDGTLLGGTTFDGALSGAAGRDWDSPTFEVPLSAAARSVELDVNRIGLSSYDCLSFGAMVLSTEVQDADEDGLLDVWEDADTTALTYPDGVAVPNLFAMGARPNQRDIFFEVNYLTSSAQGACTNGNALNDHCHRPSRAVIDTVAQAFVNGGVMPHFDMGTAAEYHTPSTPPWIVPPGLASGGEAIPETACSPAGPDCEFPGIPGVVGWKRGFQALRDEVIYPTAAAGLKERFASNRKDSFRYALFAHALGIPRSEAEPNVPAKTSGIADPPGGDLMVTLGFWDNFVGTPFMQGATLLHEAGHLLGLRHFGVPKKAGNGAQIFEPNCKPNYQSVMNYLFQTRGLICDAASTPATAPACVGAGKAGQPVIDFSRQALNGLNEAALSEGNPGLGALAYRPRWYSTTSFIDGQLGASAPATFCDGTPAPPGTQMYRVEGTSLTAPIDWLADGTTNAGTVSQNINFDAAPADTLLPGNNDWATIDLRHVGSRRNVSGLSLGITANDLGKGDLGKGDLGKGDLGKGDLGKGDLGKGDLGKGDLGIPPADNAPVGDLDLDTARHVGNAPTLQIPVVGKKQITLTWTPPHVDVTAVTSYSVWRVTGSTVTPANFAARVLVGGGPVMGSPVPTTVIDTDVKNNTTYTYFVQAAFVIDGEPKTSGVSNFQTVLNK